MNQIPPTSRNGFQELHINNKISLVTENRFRPVLSVNSTDGKVWQ